MKKLLIPAILSIAIFLLLIPIFATLTANLHPIVLPVLFCCLFVMNTAFCLLAAKKHITMPRNVLFGCYILYTIALLILLFLRPNEQNYNSVNLVPFQTISLYLSGNADWFISFYNLAANIGLFVPYGILFMLLFKNKLTLALLPFLLISMVEITQYITSRGSLDIDDLILNVAGFYIGYAIYPLFQRIVKI